MNKNKYLIKSTYGDYDMFKIFNIFGYRVLKFKRVSIDDNGKILSDKYKKLDPKSLCSNNNNYDEVELNKIKNLFNIMSILNPTTWSDTFEYWIRNE